MLLETYLKQETVSNLVTFGIVSYCLFVSGEKGVMGGSTESLKE